MARHRRSWRQGEKRANEEGCRIRGNNNGEDFPPAVFMIKQIKQDRKTPRKKGVMIYG